MNPLDASSATRANFARPALRTRLFALAAASAANAVLLGSVLGLFEVQSRGAAEALAVVAHQRIDALNRASLDSAVSARRPG